MKVVKLRSKNIPVLILWIIAIAVSYNGRKTVLAVVVVAAAAVIVVAGGVIMSFHEVAADVTILYTVLTIAYLYLCINPFIYATKFDPVKRVLLSARRAPNQLLEMQATPNE